MGGQKVEEVKRGYCSRNLVGKSWEEAKHRVKALGTPGKKGSLAHV